MLRLEDLTELLAAHPAAAAIRFQEFSIAGTQFEFNTRPAIMGVINLSGDSWYREGVCLSVESAITRVRILQAQGQ